MFVKKLENASRNIANGSTHGYKSKRASIIEKETGLPMLNITTDETPGAFITELDGTMSETSNVELSREISDLLGAQKGYEANLKSIKAQEEMIDSLLDITV